tara:strand:+ start:676 stop:1215 length:540 start_codon:yes stop_codon:yes gene_type:complete
MLKINKDTHRIKDIKFYDTCNYDERPNHIVIDTIIIHCISLPYGEYDNNNIVDLFLNKLDISKHESFSDLSNLRVSSHLLISRKGDISQFVPFNLRAWHAGQSCYNGRENFNDFSIGIELEGTNDSEFTGEQYKSLNEVITLLKSLYTNIVNDNILGHSDIAPGRKMDPGHLFDWSKIK